MPSPQASDRWQIGNPYEQYIGRWSRRVAPSFLTWLDVPAGKRWLDVGCGTGALCAAIMERCAPASLTGIEPSEGFLEVARETLPIEVTLLPGTADAIPLADGSADVVVSGLVMNFVPDLGAALEEVRRVAAKGATFGAYVWDYAGKMDIMRHYWDAAVAVNPDAVSLDEGARFPLCHRDALLTEVTRAGLHHAELTAIDVPTPFASFEEFWEPFLGGQGPAPAHAMSLDESTRSKLRDMLQMRLPIQADGSIPLQARAWAIRATV